MAPLAAASGPPIAPSAVVTAAVAPPDTMSGTALRMLSARIFVTPVSFCSPSVSSRASSWKPVKIGWSRRVRPIAHAHADMTAEPSRRYPSASTVQANRADWPRVGTSGSS
jgi:hypothetical protein